MKLIHVKKMIDDLIIEYGDEYFILADIWTPKDIMRTLKTWDKEVTEQQAIDIMEYMEDGYDTDYGYNSSLMLAGYDDIVLREY